MTSILKQMRIDKVSLVLGCVASIGFFLILAITFMAGYSMGQEDLMVQITKIFGTTN